MAGNVLTIEFPFGDVEKDKRISDRKIHEGMKLICALLNSNGGIIYLRSKKKETFNVDKLVRKFEQRLKEVIGSCGSCHKFQFVSHTTETLCHGSEVTFRIAGSLTLCTLNYNLYLPNETEVNLIAPNEPLASVLSILNGPNVIDYEQLITLGSHRKEFVMGQTIDSRESKTEQFKKLKHESSKHICLGDRIVNKSNKFACYVSAFGNYRGGHIYYGIRDDGVIEGEVIEEKDKKVIINKVKKGILKLIWPNDCGPPVKARHWDIFFEPVTDSRHKQIPSTFVIVVSVIHCPGGVFAEKPESYVVTSGKSEAMPFEMWKRRLVSANVNLHHFSNRRNTRVPPSVGRCTLSSATEMARLCLRNRENLARLRNNGDKTGFENIANEIAVGNAHDNLKVIVLQQRAACLYRIHDFEEAYRVILHSKELLKLSEEVLVVSEIENLYWESLLNRSLGRNTECESCRISGMQMMETAPVDIIGAWFYFQQGRAIERRLSENCDESDALIEEAKLCYMQALKQASQLAESTGVVELKQRVHNRLAMLHLGCFFHENKITRTKRTLQHDLEEAERMLEIVNRSSRCQGWSMSEFCRCEYLLARSEQNYRSWQTFRDEHFLELALEDSNTAHRICEKKNFEEMKICIDAELLHINCHLR